MNLYNGITRYEPDLQYALNVARSHQLSADAERLGLPPEPADPLAAVKHEIAVLASRGAPAAKVAAALIDTGNLPVLPLDRDLLVPSGEQITDLAGVLEHWRVNPADGVAVPTGSLPNGLCLLALRGAPAALRAWLADVGTEVVTKLEDDRVIDERRTYRPMGHYTQVRWTPPRRRTGVAVATLGSAALQRTTDELLNGHRRENDERTAWVCWSSAIVITSDMSYYGSSSLPPLVRRRLVVRKPRKGSHGGVELIADSEFVPQFVITADGWTLDATAMPSLMSDQQLPEWLLEVFGARWADERQVDGVWKPAAA